MNIFIRQVTSDGGRYRSPCNSLEHARRAAAACLRAARADGCEVRRIGPMAWSARDGLDIERLRVVVRP